MPCAECVLCPRGEAAGSGHLECQFMAQVSHGSEYTGLLLPWLNLFPSILFFLMLLQMGLFF